MNYNFSLYFLVTLFTLTLISAIFLLEFTIKIMNKFGIVDKPSGRRAHAVTTPRGGGIGFMLIFAVLLPISEYYILGFFDYSIKILQIFIPLSLISLWDDIQHIAVPLRLFVQIICTYFAITSLISPNRLLHQELPANLDIIISSFALLAFMNIYNFLDGIDGITAAESIHLSLTILILCLLRGDIIPHVELIILISVIILAWSIGFMFFNWHPANIFIGDVGTIGLGFLIGICLINIASASEHLFAATIIASLYYITDGALTILIRLSKGEKIWQPHLQHFFQKAVKKGKSHGEVTAKIMQCNLILMLLAINSLYYPIVSIVISIITIIVTITKLVL